MVLLCFRLVGPEYALALLLIGHITIHITLSSKRQSIIGIICLENIINGLNMVYTGYFPQPYQPIKSFQIIGKQKCQH